MHQSMHKSFYASGFLYNLKTQQILLLQSDKKDDIAPNWSMLGGEGKEGEDAAVAFQRIIHELLDIELKIKQIHPIYDYFHDQLNRDNYVFYAEVKKAKTFDPLKENTLSWVTFEQTVKLLFSTQTKQDVVVGERVIHLKEREDEASREGVIPISPIQN